MDTTRRGFLAAAVTAAGAAAIPNATEAADAAHDHQALPSDLTLRVKSLESLLVEKGLVDPAALDALVDTFEHKVGPHLGARVVAKAWTDPAYKQRVLVDAEKAIDEFGYRGLHIIAVENTPRVHNVVVCTLCSCYPNAVLGLPPVWYKSAPYRSRTIIDPRGVLRELGLEVADDVEMRVWDSNAELRYLVLPERPAGTEGMSEDALAALVTRDAMIGVAKALPAQARSQAMNGVHDMGGFQNTGPVVIEKNEPVFHAPWEGRIYALNQALRSWGKWNLNSSRYDLELLPPADYIGQGYYQRWYARMVEQVVKAGMVTRAEVESGRAAPGSVKVQPRLTADRVPVVVQNGTSYKRNVAVAPAFRVGQRVRARNINTVAHTRLPRYARGRSGIIERDYGVFVFPDTDAMFQGEKPQHLYSVRFAARELWGGQAKPQDRVYLNMWDDYLEPA